MSCDHEDWKFQGLAAYGVTKWVCAGCGREDVLPGATISEVLQAASLKRDRCSHAGQQSAEGHGGAQVYWCHDCMTISPEPL